MVTEECVHFDDIGMCKETLNLDLPDQLNEQFLINIELINPLNCTKKPTFLVPRNKHLTELTRPQFPAQFKIVYFH